MLNQETYAPLVTVFILYALASQTLNIIISVRYMAVKLWFRDKYKKAFNPTSTRRGIVKCNTTRGTLGTFLIFCYWGLSETLICNKCNTLLREGHIRILTYSIEGLITNLQSLVTMERELDGLDVHLEFSLRTNKDERKRPWFFR